MSTPLEKAVEEAQAALSGPTHFGYDRDSWDIFVGNQMQKVLDAARADALTDEQRAFVAQQRAYNEAWKGTNTAANAEQWLAIYDTLARADAPDVEALDGETWRCPSCRDTTAPMGMCQKCGVFGLRYETVPAKHERGCSMVNWARENSPIPDCDCTQRARLLAERILDRPSGDPDDDLAILARATVRSHDEKAEARADALDVVALGDLLTRLHGESCDCEICLMVQPAVDRAILAERQP